MIKKIFAILLIVVLACAICGCSGKRSIKPPKPIVCNTEITEVGHNP